MKNRILVACVGVPIILVVLFVLPAPVTPALIAVLSAVGTYEALHAIGMNHPRISLYTAIIALGIPFWVYFGEPLWVGLLALLIHLVAVFAEAFASSSLTASPPWCGWGPWSCGRAISSCPSCSPSWWTRAR